MENNWVQYCVITKKHVSIFFLGGGGSGLIRLLSCKHSSWSWPAKNHQVYLEKKWSWHRWLANVKPLTANSGWPFVVSWPKLDPKVSVEKCWAWFLKQEVFLEGKTGVLLAFLPESLSGLPRPSLSFPPPWTFDRRLEDHCYCRISIWRRATCHIFFRGLGHCILHNEPTLRRVLVP